MRIRIIELDPVLCVLPWSMEVARKENVAKIVSVFRVFLPSLGLYFYEYIVESISGADP